MSLKSIHKAVELLRLLAVPPHEVSVAQAARAAGMTTSTASRILAALRAGDLVDQDPLSRRYRPGVLALQLASGFQRGFDILDRVQQTMAELVQVTRHTAWVGILAGNDVVVLKTLQGAYPVRFGVEPGRRLPAHAAAMGKALLALKADEEIRRMCAEGLLDTPAHARTPRTIATPAALLAELALIRRRGYAESNQELFEGIKAVATAFAGPHGESPVALSISYPLVSVAESGDAAIIATLLEHARRIGQRIGDPRWLAKAGPGQPA